MNKETIVEYAVYHDLMTVKMCEKMHEERKAHNGRKTSLYHKLLNALNIHAAKRNVYMQFLADVNDEKPFIDPRPLMGYPGVYDDALYQVKQAAKLYELKEVKTNYTECLDMSHAFMLVKKEQ